MRIIYFCILVTGLVSTSYCSSLTSTPIRSQYDVAISKGPLPGLRYESVGLVNYRTNPRIAIFSFLPPIDYDSLMREVGTGLREDLSVEALEMGGNAIINVQVNEISGGFSFIIPFYSYSLYEVTGEVVRLEKK